MLPTRHRLILPGAVLAALVAALGLVVVVTAGNGKLKLAAVEWIVPAEPWDEAGNTMPPEIHGRHLHLNEALGVYVLHAWIFRNNPAGTFEDWNPKVSCP